MDINPTKEINQLQERSEIQTSIIVQVNTVEIFQGMNWKHLPHKSPHGSTYLLVVTTICNWNIGITRGGC